MLKSVLSILAQALHDEGHLDLQETFIDGSFAPAKKGGARVGKTKRGNGSKIMAIADRHGRPIAVHVESAAPHDVTLVNATLAKGFVEEEPERLVGDSGYESDRLDEEVAEHGVVLIAPHRMNRKRKTVVRGEFEGDWRGGRGGSRISYRPLFVHMLMVKHG